MASSSRRTTTANAPQNPPAPIAESQAALDDQRKLSEPPDAGHDQAIADAIKAAVPNVPEDPWAIDAEPLPTLGPKLQAIPESILKAAQTTVDTGVSQAFCVDGWSDDRIRALKRFIRRASAHVERGLRPVDQMRDGRQLVAIQLLADKALTADGDTNTEKPLTEGDQTD